MAAQSQTIFTVNGSKNTATVIERNLTLVYAHLNLTNINFCCKIRRLFDIFVNLLNKLSALRFNRADDKNFLTGIKYCTLARK